MPWKSRSLILSLFGTVYVLVAATRASSDRALGSVALLLVPLGLLLVWSWSEQPARGEDWVGTSTRSAMRAVGVGGALLVAARVAPDGSAPFEAVATLSSCVASVAALVAIARIAPLGGLFIVPQRARRLRAATAVGAVGAVAAGLPFWQNPDPSGRFSDLQWVDTASSIAAILSLMVMVGAALHARRLRKFDLGVPERLSAAVVAGLLALVVGVPTSLLRLAPASHVLEAATWLAAFAVTTACLVRDPSSVARAQRVLSAVCLLAAPVALLGVSIGSQLPSEGGLVALLSLLAGLSIGLAGPTLARPLAPEQSRWLDALDSAALDASRSPPESALIASLATLRRAFAAAPTAPEIWSLEPQVLLTVDRAGYPHTDSGVVAPPFVYELAESQPERTLRTEALESVEVRRPDVRPALQWLRDRGAMSFTLLHDQDGPLGALVLPAGTRSEPLTLEEVRALRSLADRLAAVLGSSAALARARARELLVRQIAERESNRVQALERLMSSVSVRNESLARRASRSVLIARYSSAARVVLDELERVAKTTMPLALLSPPGVDPVPYAAFVHGAGPRPTGPFVVVDAAGAEEQKETFWRDPSSSPLRLADGGSLLIVSVAGLPVPVQTFLADALSPGKTSGDAEQPPRGIALLVSVPMTIDALAAAGRLEPALADLLGDRAIPLPSLVARTEDLRTLFMERLARIGVRLKGRPMGLDARALTKLVEHAWPGNETELDDVLTRAATVADGEVVTTSHLDQIGFVALPPSTRRSLRSLAPGQQPLES